MEVLMHGHHNTLLSVMTLDQRLIEIKQKSIGEQPMRKHLIQFIPLESLPPEFSACVETINAWDEVVKALNKAWDEARAKLWDNARNEVVKARNEARNNFTRLCALHKGALEVLHRERCLSIHPDCPWNGERLVGIG